MKDTKKEITKILTQLSGKTFNSPEQVNEFFELALWRIARIKDENWQRKIEEALPEEEQIEAYLGDNPEMKLECGRKIGWNTCLKNIKANLLNKER